MAIALIFVLIQSNSIAQETISAVVKKVIPSVVMVMAFDQEGNLKRQGTGFFISSSEIITCFHVVEDVFLITIKTSKGDILFVKEILSVDLKSDLAMLSVETKGKKFPFLELAPQESLEIGQTVIVVGNPLGLESTVSTGIISALREVPEFGRLIQITAPVSLGSSGSPVVDLKGNLIGVAAATLLWGQNLNFAMPVERIAALKEVEKPKLEELEEIIAKIKEKLRKTSEEAGETLRKEKKEQQEDIQVEAKAQDYGEDINYKMDDYYNIVWQRVKEKWTLPKIFLNKEEVNNLVSILVIEINRDGKIIKIWFEKRSGNIIYDIAARRAILKAEPLPPFPKEIPDKTIEIGIVFRGSQ